MKRLIERAVRPLWRMTAPIRRPIVRKLDAKIHRMVATSIRTEVLPTIEASLASSARVLERLDGSVGAANRTADALACDMDSMLGSVIREVARLQAQVDALEGALGRPSTPGRTGLALHDSDDGAAGARPSIERAKVG